MKKLINEPRRVVREMLEGIADTTPGLALLDAEDVVIRSDLPMPADRQVAVISGGGAGHEPAHAGYVGSGILSAAVVGDVFTSPSEEGTETTAQMTPRLSRASYLGARALGVEDAGAAAVTVWLAAIGTALEQRSAASEARS